MVFSSPIFLFLFLPLVLGLYLMAGPRLRNSVLLAASLIFYAWGETGYVLVLLFSIAGNYLFGRWIGGRALKSSAAARALAAGVIFNLGLLIFFKYANFLADNLDALLSSLGLPAAVTLSPIHLPIGISFFTFQALSYLIDVYRGVSPAQKSPFKLGLFISMFPQLIAGPIVRYNQIAEELADRDMTLDNWAAGIRRFSLGLGKKVLLANTLGAVADRIFELPADGLTAGLAWLGAVCYALQIYYDFSGYSDMAIGLGRVFGFHFPENFQYPYISQSIREFWRRWHMTLSFWFRDYLYIPLGGSRKGEFRTYLHLLIVFALCGLWHGASWTFLFWGLYHGFFLVLERLGLEAVLNRLPRPLRHAYAVLVIVVGWVFFRAESLTAALYTLRAMFGLGVRAGVGYLPEMYFNQEILGALVVGLVAAAPLLPALSTAAAKLKPRWLIETADLGLTFSVLLLSAVYLANSTYNPFIYFRF